MERVQAIPLVPYGSILRIIQIKLNIMKKMRYVILANTRLMYLHTQIRAGGRYAQLVGLNTKA